jgi:hypothetical protein
MNRHTLDVEHRNRLLDIETAAIARTELQACSRSVSGSDTPATSVALMRARLKCDKLERDVGDLEKRSDKLTYHLKTGKILLKYYDISEGLTFEGEAVKQDEPGKSILSYFVPRPPDLTKVDVSASACTKAGLMDAFLKVVEQAPEQPCQSVHCTMCGGSNTVVYILESQRVCADCDAVEYVVLDNERSGSSAHSKDGNAFHFKRATHLLEWVQSSEGREHAIIPDQVFNTVLTEL